MQRRKITIKANTQLTTQGTLRIRTYRYIAYFTAF